MPRSLRSLLFSLRSRGSKSIFLAGADRRAVAASPEDLMIGGRNDFRGWTCSAGAENIFIDAEGDYYAAACRSGGALGNVFKAGNPAREGWITCDKSFCHCGSDMQLKKFKSQSARERFRKVTPAHLKFDWKAGGLADPVAIGPVNSTFYDLTCNWEFGRRCNYSCSYCHPNLSNHHERHRTWAELLAAADEIERFFARGKSIRFAIAGGEPTLNPSYLDLVRKLKERGHVIHTQTNGSRPPKYYRELFTYGSIGISIHLEFTRRDHILKIVHEITRAKKSWSKWRSNWLCIRIMSGPGRVDEALEWRKALLPYCGSHGINELSMAPLFDRLHADRLQEYRPEEMSQLTKFATTTGSDAQV